MKSKSLIPIPFMFTCLGLLVVCFIASIATMFLSEVSVLEIIIRAAYCVTIVFAMFYCLLGYRTNQALSFQCFLYAYTISALLQSICFPGLSEFARFFLVAPFGCLCVFTFGRNIGKGKSFLLAGVIFVCDIVAYIISIFYLKMPFDLPSISNLLLSFVLCTMLFGHYIDRPRREAPKAPAEPVSVVIPPIPEK